jgi:hypothetical protein
MELKKALELIDYFERAYCETSSDGPVIKVTPFTSSVKLDEEENQTEIETILDYLYSNQSVDISKI